ncbi:MAG: TetR/AcrR family transcriptional regulator [Alphaproteobacteria bacterium]|nr:TetR/AcrR family transcriptional regulator [Alphaproteobacteria bacterium]
MSERDAIREQIIEAAKKRFWHYGYAKTTMAEVAADCGMSPGNLYRFFPGKLDIAEAIGMAEFECHMEVLRALATASGRSARQRLHDFFFESLRHTYTVLENNPRIHEMAQVIARERPEYANSLYAIERTLLCALLADGEAAGEFRSTDRAFTAEMLQSATMKFCYPQLWSQLTLPKLERELEGVLALLIDGLAQAA